MTPAVILGRCTARACALTACLATWIGAQELVLTNRATPLFAAPDSASAVVRRLPALTSVTPDSSGVLRDHFIRVSVDSVAGWVDAGTLTLGQDSSALTSVMRELDKVFGAISGVFRSRPEAPPFIPLSGHNWYTTRRFEYRVGQTATLIVIDSGFVTDFASVPQFLWWLFPPTGDYKLSALIHDFLYWGQPCTRAQADNLFFIAMLEEDIPAWKRNLLYSAVATLGEEAWDSNRVRRGSGGTRFIPSTYRPRAGATWAQVQRDLLSAGVRDPAMPSGNQGACRLGDSRSVPGPS